MVDNNNDDGQLSSLATPLASHSITASSTSPTTTTTTTTTPAGMAHAAPPPTSPVIVTPVDNTPSSPLGDVQALSQPVSPTAAQQAQNAAKTLLLPMPIPSATKPSRLSFTMPDPSSSLDEKLVLNPLPPELASADITLAPDGSFIETTSGQAARELKRRYDQLYGVSKEVRSPYAITAFINQHGKQMYRLGHRELEAPGAAAAEYEQRFSHSHPLTSPDPSRSPKSKRRSLISMHNLLHHPMFKNNASSSARPSTSSNATVAGPRKLRKTRSIPDMASITSQETSSSISGLHQTLVDNPSTGRAHSQSLTAADIAPFARLPSTGLPLQPTAYFVPSRHGDTFSQVMDWVISSPDTSGVSTPSIGASSPTHQFSTSLILHPFGTGVIFDSPSRKPFMDFLPMPRHIREMQSFESNLTARQVEHRSSVVSGYGSSGGIFQLKEENEEVERPGSALRRTTPTPKLCLPLINTASSSVEAETGSSSEQALAQGPVDAQGLVDANGDDMSVPTPTSTSPLPSLLSSHSPVRIPSPSPQSQPTPSLSEPVQPTISPREIIYAPLHETSMISRWSTDVFDVLQTYRGLPLLDKLDPDMEGETTVIKMSLSKDQSVAPKDDPRFVIWGELVGGLLEEERRRDMVGSMSDFGMLSEGATGVGGGAASSGVTGGGVGASTTASGSVVGDAATVQSNSASSRKGLGSISGKSSTSSHQNKDKDTFGRPSMSRKRSLRNVGASVTATVTAVRSRSKSQQGQQVAPVPPPLPLGLSMAPVNANGVGAASGGSPAPGSSPSTPTTAGSSAPPASSRPTSLAMASSPPTNLATTAPAPTASTTMTTTRPTTSSSVATNTTTNTTAATATTTATTADEDGAKEPKKVLVAATIERWIAQLTSDLDYDELLNFFLTYRTYVTAVDLCHLLISRFHWALQSRVFVVESGSAGAINGDDIGFGSGMGKWKRAGAMENEDVVKRVVRVRTFVAVRYWLVTFFVEDFVPNRELRLLLAEWLNTLLKDPILKVHIDGMGIVKRLIKVAKDCKAAHTNSKPRPKGSAKSSQTAPTVRGNSSAATANTSASVDDHSTTGTSSTNRNTITTATSASSSSTAPSSTPSGTTMTTKRDHLLGEKFAQAVARKPPVEEDDSDLDLDFLPEESSSLSSDLTMDDVIMTAAANGNRPTSIPLSSLSILQGAGHALHGATTGKVVCVGDLGHGHATSRNSGAGAGPGTVSGPAGVAGAGGGQYGGSNAQMSMSSSPPPPPPPSTVLPVYHNAFSRVLTKAVGRLGRWKRVLNSRTTGRTSLGACVDVSAIEFDELTLVQDLLTVNGGVEHYLGLTQQQYHQRQQEQQDYHQLHQLHQQLQLQQQQQQLYYQSQQVPLTTTRQHPHTSGVASTAPIPPTPPPAGKGPTAVPPPLSPSSSSLTTASDAVNEARDLVHVEGAQRPPASAGASSNASTAETAVDYSRPISMVDEDPRVSVSVESVRSMVSVNGMRASQNSDLDFDAQSLQFQGSLAPPLYSSSRLSHPTAGSFGGAPSFRSNSTDSFGVPLPPSRRQWEFDIVSIDDLEFSDTSSMNEDGNHSATAVALGGPSQPPGLGGAGGLRKLPRRLPMRKDFEFIRRPESVSSMGIISRDSMASSAGGGNRYEGGDDDENRQSRPPVALGGGIQQWQMNALFDSISDDDEPGDVEDALKRLEGQINVQKRKEKVAKVDGWIKSIQQRMARGDYGEERPRWMDSDEEEEMESLVESAKEEDEDEGLSSVATTPVREEQFANHDQPWQSPNNSAVEPSSASNPSIPSSSHAPSETTTVLRPTIPLAILESRVSAQPVSPGPQQQQPQLRPTTAQPKVRDQRRLSRSSNFASSSNTEPHRSIHRSFILGHRAEALARHFAMIDRELFLCVKFDELVSVDWMTCKEVEVFDWAQFMRDRLRWKAEGVSLEKTTALAAVRARFNLLANFTMSEVVLTPPQERPVVVAKFIRIAWKSYCLSSFNTLVAIITGLQSEWVTQATRKSWNKIGMWEKRMFNDLKAFINNTEDFWYIKKAVDTIADAKPLEVGSHASVVSGGATDSGRAKVAPSPTACVPFIGIYLSQLYRINKLPDLIDPTAPIEAVPLNPETAAFEPPAHPEVFDSLAPLPPTMTLEPLINVHKQRKIAAVVKSLVGGQHLASGVHFELDKKLVQRCLRLRGLPVDTLNRVLQVYSE